MAKKNGTKKSPRPYSYEFTASDPKTARRYLLSGIPAKLWITFSARCKREGIAKRQVLLQAVTDWTTRPE